MKPEVVQGSLLEQDVDIIVNAWNRNIIPWWLLLPQGVSGAIKKRGGCQPFREVAKHGAIPLGNKDFGNGDFQNRKQHKKSTCIFRSDARSRNKEDQLFDIYRNGQRCCVVES